MSKLIETICIILIIIGFVLLVLSLTLNAYYSSEVPSPDTSLTYEKCCNGNFCTDTYYSKKRDKCILSLCEGSPLIFNKAKCEYEPTR